MKKKKLSLKFKILILVISLFLAYNLVWFLFITIKWKPYESKMDDKDDSGAYKIVGEFGKDNRYVLSVSKPGYLRFTGGNLAISQTFYDENVPTVEIIAVPEWNGYKMNVRIMKTTQEENVSYDETVAVLELNEKMEFYDDSFSDDEKETLEKYKDIISKAYETMNAVWELN